MVAAKRLVPYVRVLSVLVFGIGVGVVTHHHPQPHPHPVETVVYGPYVPVVHDDADLLRTSRSEVRKPLPHRHQDVPVHRQSRPVTVPPAVQPSLGTIWDRLAQCESGGNWADTAGSYEGGLQFSTGTWISYGGGRYAAHAYDATREEQIAVATRVQAAAGWGQWPVCSAELGLR